jgi:hypothetical protein
MIEYTLWTLGFVWLFYLNFILFAAWHTAKVAGRPIYWLSTVLLAPPIFIGYLQDLIFNATIGSVLFLEWPWAFDGPRFWSWTYTRRCRRHRDDPDWQGSIARWTAKVLNPFDEGHV